MERTALFGVAFATATILAGSAWGQTIYGFGDSLLDTRRVCPLLSGTYAGAATYGTCSNGKGTLEFLPSYTSYSFSKANDYASGGAGTGSFNVAAPLGPVAVGTDTEISDFAAAGGHINANDLVVMSGIPNNVFELGRASGPTGAGLAQTALSDISHGVSALVGAGARNLVYYGGSPMDGGAVNEVGGAQATIYTQDVNAGLAAALAPFARPGVRIRLFDFEAVFIKAATDPGYYGFTTGATCVSDPSCLRASLAVQDQRFQYDVHPTQAGEQLLARYIAALITSDDGLADQADIAAAADDQFNSVLLRQLESQRGDTPSGLADGAAPPNRLTLFVKGGHAQNDQNDWTGLGGAADGYTDDQDSLAIGGAYRAGDHLLAGAAVGYTRSTGRLDNSGGDLDVDSEHVGGFASLVWPTHFVDLVVSYSHHDLFTDRAGVVGRIDGASQGDTVGVGGQGGWLFGLGPLQIGPLVTLQYDRTRIGAFTETGDDVLTQHLEPQVEQTLAVGAGIQVRAHVKLFGRLLQPFLDLSAQENLLYGSRTLVSENTVAQALPIYTVIDAGRNDRTFGHLSTGMQAPLFAGIDLVVDGQATAFRNGNAYAVNLAFSRAF